jgi:hypothetical protein
VLVEGDVSFFCLDFFSGSVFEEAFDEGSTDEES